MRNTLPVLCVLAVGVSAQVPPVAPTGNFAGVPFGLIWKNASTGKSTDLYARWYGNPGPTVALPPGTANHPGFRAQDLGAALGQAIGREVPTPDLDGLSTFNDQLPLQYVSGTRFEVLPASQTFAQWGIVFMNAKKGAQLSPGSVLHTQRAAIGHIGTEVVGHYIDSTAIPGFVANSSYLEMSQTFLSSVPPGVGEQPQLCAIDLAMPNIVLWNGAPNPPQEMRVLDRIAFSVTAAYVNILNSNPMNPPATIGTGPSARPLHGTSIVTAWWNGSAWTGLTIVADYTDIPHLNSTDDVDAVGIGELPQGVSSNLMGSNHPDFDYILVSHVRRQGTREQLQVYIDHQTLGKKSGPMFTGSGSSKPTITDASGIRPGEDVKAICTGDPEGATHGRLWGVCMHDNPGAGLPDPATFVTSTVFDSTKTDGKNTGELHLFASGVRPDDGAMVLFVGDSSIPLQFSPTALQVYLGIWGKNTRTFSRKLTVALGLNFDSVLYRVDLSPQAARTRAAWNGIRTR